MSETKNFEIDVAKQGMLDEISRLENEIRRLQIELSRTSEKLLAEKLEISKENKKLKDQIDDLKHELNAQEVFYKKLIGTTTNLIDAYLNT